MSTREKIVVGLMVLAVLWGGYTLLFTGSETREGGVVASNQQIEDTRAFVQNTTQTVAQETSAPGNTPYLLKRAAETWPRDPFLDRQTALTYEAEKMAQEETKEVSAAELGLVYSGYLMAGDKSLAVINGLEYEEGEKLDREGGYIVKTISPIQVVIGREGSTSRIIVPLEETEF
jgi:hypothetical protein